MITTLLYFKKLNTFFVIIKKIFSYLNFLFISICLSQNFVILHVKIVENSRNNSDFCTKFEVFSRLQVFDHP